jgi:hypothetical protein
MLPAAQQPCGLRSLQQKRGSEDIYGGKARPARKADNLTHCQNNVGSSTFLNHIGFHVLLQEKL